MVFGSNERLTRSLGLCLSHVGQASKRDKSNTSALARSITGGLPYVSGLSKHLSRIFRSHGTNTCNKPCNTLRSQLVRPKDKTSPEKKTGVVYDISCNGCGEHCIGETSRALGKRLGEHPQKQTASAVWEHQSTGNHEIDCEGIKILDQETGDIKRKIKEVIRNRRQRPTLNRDGDYEPPAILNRLLSRD